ncbi:3-alpha-hydroxysteroid dehydrogenase/carbonyl reductase OS=Tsukamurella paurometabola OX=2061 GN=hsdA PE=3 SV=1 [Tsukamurella paurometabola]|uniref:hypothetical protein n=1 Tax=Tsukamurella paurometabola TaxID=2061 RepID=UPI00019F0121|nr:hypothetical protein [Tsukamurella paurometabola]SUP38173.1 3-alpha-hydroxysteroid dehydrogenase/carbonyl reductase [Tsukamurella paurometabola]
MGVYVITGAASGLGAATADRLHAAGHGVIGVDLSGADVDADLGTSEGRSEAVTRIGELVGESPIDGFAAFAGLGPGAGRTGSSLVSVNYFGAVDLLAGIRHLLARSLASSAILVSSNSTTTQPGWPMELADACLAGDEALARGIADSYGEYGSVPTYPATKAALAYWRILGIVATPSLVGPTIRKCSAEYSSGALLGSAVLVALRARIRI